MIEIDLAGKGVSVPRGVVGALAAAAAARAGVSGRHRDLSLLLNRALESGRAILAQADAEDDEIHALDERLKKLLTACDKRVWESAPGDPFWDFGYPGNAGPGLLDDLGVSL